MLLHIFCSNERQHLKKQEAAIAAHLLGRMLKRCQSPDENTQSFVIQGLFFDYLLVATAEIDYHQCNVDIFSSILKELLSRNSILWLIKTLYLSS